MAEEPTQQLQVEDEVTLAAEKLGLLFDEVDDQESDESDYYREFLTIIMMFYSARIEVYIGF